MKPNSLSFQIKAIRHVVIAAEMRSALNSRMFYSFNPPPPPPYIPQLSDAVSSPEI